MKHAPSGSWRSWLAALVLAPLSFLGACGGVSVAVCGDWWCVGTPIPPPCYYCFSLSSAAADLNGDGILDAIYSAEDNGMVKVRLGDGAGGVAAEQVFPRGLTTIDLMRAADVDGDTNVDVILIDSAGGQLQVLLSNGTGGLPTQGPIVPIPGATHIVDAEVGRVDGGTMDDIVLVDDTGGVIAMLGGAGGAMTVAPAGRQVLPCGGTDLDLGLIDGNTLADIVVTNEAAMSVCVYAGTGNGAFTSLGSLDVTDPPVQPLLVELDGQPGLDLALLMRDGLFVEAWFGNGQGGFTRSPQGLAATGQSSTRMLALPNPAAPTGPVGLAVLGGGPRIGSVAALPNRGDGWFILPAPSATLSHAATAGIVTDLESDGRLDMIVLSAGGISVLTGGSAQD